MSTSIVSLSSQKSAAGITLDPQLQNLYLGLRNLPTSLPNHPETYPFAEKFALDQHDIKFYG
ncbi:hypothetical protein RhiTH_011695, partial [Rhizoctonia solani]